MDTVGAPLVVIGRLYQPKTLELRAPDDPVCSDGGDRPHMPLMPTMGWLTSSESCRESSLASRAIRRWLRAKRIARNCQR